MRVNVATFGAYDLRRSKSRIFRRARSLKKRNKDAERTIEGVVELDGLLRRRGNPSNLSGALRGMVKHVLLV
jgi:hypothetical protein